MGFLSLVYDMILQSATTTFAYLIWSKSRRIQAETSMRMSSQLPLSCDSSNRSTVRNISFLFQLPPKYWSFISPSGRSWHRHLPQCHPIHHQHPTRQIILRISNYWWPNTRPKCSRLPGPIPLPLCMSSCAPPGNLECLSLPTPLSSSHLPIWWKNRIRRHDKRVYLGKPHFDLVRGPA